MLRYKNFETIVKKERLEIKTQSEQDVQAVVLKLFNELFNKNISYRSCGISLDDISYSKNHQQSLFDTAEPKDDKLGKAIDELEHKFGKNIIKAGWI